eukprot:scaffold4359_cov106-Isochrysis_galbana.AAC.1
MAPLRAACGVRRLRRTSVSASGEVCEVHGTLLVMLMAPSDAAHTDPLTDSLDPNTVDPRRAAGRQSSGRTLTRSHTAQPIAAPPHLTCLLPSPLCIRIPQTFRSRHPHACERVSALHPQLTLR